ncbi:MAG: HPr family phosphocarrier protein [Cellulosilyticaceae bacterium]
MTSVEVSLNSIEKVKQFVNLISQYDGDFDLTSGRYVIDAKSIMGIFSLDLSKPIRLDIHDDDMASILMMHLKDFRNKD